ncbi:uncharacterized protein LOC116611705 isoform X1 [Nematostella vectensis]|uniref:uncharacterized protein LOC116611705 isoform X1 n=1 Tax=Nematostella vectensis TaxID=45351 RepID=UPI0020771ACE|nr:uncharacterized protein LOC116611705 isoform X1 [Nematostella vectensis]
MRSRILVLAAFAVCLGSAHAQCDQSMVMKDVAVCQRQFIGGMASDPGANCSVLYKNMTTCAHDIVFQKCFGTLLQQMPGLRTEIEKVFSLMLSSYNLDVTYCGVQLGEAVNRTQISPMLKALVPCDRDKLVEKSRKCNEGFFAKFRANRTDPALCSLLAESKRCDLKVSKEHCQASMVAPLDPYNPFCPNDQDPTNVVPTVKAGAAREKIWSVRTALSLCLALMAFTKDY